ncbi:Gfo/Idh/MocA family oxidoreductase [Actinoplanes sp. NPDC023936]|uniref:Gfo/Idh/MocA family protein n=1 Tax=Actinoplanes sp. NPDC023936 TaxID=3154910 RepID=UPI0034082A98
MTVPAPEDGRIRIAVAGLGWAGRSIWLPRLRDNPAYRLIAAVDPDPASREAAADTVAGLSTMASLDELDPAAVDLAVVAVPNHLHAAAGSALLRRGIPVFLEKPVCLSEPEVDQLAGAERAGGAVLLAGSAGRYRADVRALLDVVRGLGTIRHIDLAWVRSRGIPRAGGWFTRREMSGGGALVDLGWHLLDTLVPVLGPVGFPHVVGTVSDDFLHDDAWRAAWRADEQGGAGGDVEDTARGFLVTDDGVSVALRASWASHQPQDTTTIAVEASGGVATLRCTFGFSPNRPGAATLTVTRNGVTEEVPLPDEPIGSEYDRQLAELPALLAAPHARGQAAEEARRTIGVIERFYDSARTRRKVHR